MAKDLTHMQSVINQMRDIQDSIKRLQERYDVMRDIVINELAGDNEGIIDDKPVVTYTTTTSRRFDMQWLKSQMPDIYDAGRREQTGSRFQLIVEAPDGQ